jgi:hypothetical protein
MTDPLKCLQETHRTLKDGGLAAVLTWRRFGAGEVIGPAQRMARPDCRLWLFRARSSWLRGAC